MFISALQSFIHLANEQQPQSKKQPILLSILHFLLGILQLTCCQGLPKQITREISAWLEWSLLLLYWLDDYSSILLCGETTIIKSLVTIRTVSLNALWWLERWEKQGASWTFGVRYLSAFSHSRSQTNGVGQCSIMTSKLIGHFYCHLLPLAVNAHASNRTSTAFDMHAPFSFYGSHFINPFLIRSAHFT